MYLPSSYQNHPLWLTIDVEVLEDANFGITKKRELAIDYERIIDEWIELCDHHSIKSCAFILGSFARRFPNAVKKLADAGHDIASHGLRHELVYKLPFDVWKEETKTSKKILEDITGREVAGYRSPSWTLPFEKRYYEALAELGFRFSSSYFPFKTYLYGNEIDKKRPFKIFTDSGTVTEIPVPKRLIPFSGGFYLRMLPAPIAWLLMKSLMKSKVKPIIYTHPYELQEGLFLQFLRDVVFDKAYILTFANTGNTKKRIEYLLKSIKDENA